jgi:uncharacterized protein YkwD
MNPRTLLTAIGITTTLTACGTAQPPAPAAPPQIVVTIYPQATKPAQSDIIRISLPAAEPTAAPVAAAINEVTPPAAPLPTAAPIEPTATPAPQIVFAAPAGGTVEGIRNELLALHNIARAEHGLPPYTMNAALQQAAQQHAEWLAQKPMQELWRLGMKGHFGPNNESYVDRISAAGYATTASRMNENYGAFGSARDAFDWWMNDAVGAATHRPQILSDLYSEVGIGVVQHASGMGFVFIIKYAGR